LTVASHPAVGGMNAGDAAEALMVDASRAAIEHPIPMPTVFHRFHRVCSCITLAFIGLQSPDALDTRLTRKDRTDGGGT